MLVCASAFRDLNPYSFFAHDFVLKLQMSAKTLMKIAATLELACLCPNATSWRASVAPPVDGLLYQ